MGKVHGRVRRAKDGWVLRLIVDPPVNHLPEFSDVGPFASEGDAKRAFGPAVKNLRVLHAKAGRAKWAPVPVAA